MSTGDLVDRSQLAEEERIVAELEMLGVRYLSRRTGGSPSHPRAPDQLLADLVRQPSARVRDALIALLLAHPEFASAVPFALARLSATDQVTLRILYTAALLLQQEYAGSLSRLQCSPHPGLPDLFSAELGLSGQGAVRERLSQLGQTHRHLTGTAVNWTGTYDNVARHLIRHWELERLWNRSPN